MKILSSVTQNYILKINIIYERTYKAIMVVNGLTTVYCKTPSLHLNNNTLQEKHKINCTSI